ncbi:hypothetical protein FQZ97_888010 [compost metagenome]
MLEIDGQRVITLLSHDFADKRAWDRKKAIHNGFALTPYLLDLVRFHRSASYWICLARGRGGPRSQR